MAVGIKIETAGGDTYSIDNLTTYSITENASPLSVADTSGGATTVQLGVQEFEGSTLLATSQLTVLEDGAAVVAGDVSAPSSDGATVSITSLSALSRLNIIKRIAPFHGTLQDYLTGVLSVAGITRSLVVDPAVASLPVVVVGFKDNLLARAKELCAVLGVELSDRGDGIYVNPQGVSTIDLPNTLQPGWSVDQSALTSSIEVFNYKSVYRTNALVYPPGSYDDDTGTSTPAGWTTDTTIIQVDAFSSITTEVPITASLTSVVQPVCQKEVGPTGSTTSEYTVMGKDGVETLDPGVWAAKGGKVTVKIEEDTQTLSITVNSGSNDPSLAPFRIAMSSGNDYASLRIVGTGVFQSKQKLTIPTGVAPGSVPDDSPLSLDSVFIGTLDQAYSAAAEAMPRCTGPFKTITVSTDDPGLTTGTIAAARMKGDAEMLRVTSAVTSQTGTQLTAEQSTMLTDLDDAWGDLTLDELDALWDDGTSTWDDFAAAPLRTS